MAESSSTKHRITKHHLEDQCDDVESPRSPVHPTYEFKEDPQSIANDERGEQKMKTILSSQASHRPLRPPEKVFQEIPQLSAASQENMFSTETKKKPALIEMGQHAGPVVSKQKPKERGFGAEIEPRHVTTTPAPNTDSFSLLSYKQESTALQLEEDFGRKTVAHSRVDNQHNSSGEAENINASNAKQLLCSSSQKNSLWFIGDNKDESSENPRRLRSPLSPETTSSSGLQHHAQEASGNTTNPENASNRRQGQFATTRPGAINVGEESNGDRDGTVVICSDTVVPEAPVTVQMEPLPASLVEEAQQEKESDTKFLRVVVALLLFLFVAGLAVGLVFSGLSSSNNDAIDETLSLTPDPVRTKWIMVGQPDDIVGLTENDMLGHYVAISGEGETVAVTTADFRARHPYILAFSVTTTNSTLQLGNKIEAPPGTIAFGVGVELSRTGEILATGGSSKNFVYRRRNDWREYGSRFGRGYKTVLSSDGSTAVVGLGVVQAYRYDNYEWSEVGQPLMGDIDSEYFGWSASLSAEGNRLAVGLPGSNGNTGRVQVFELLEDGEEALSWNQIGSDIVGIQEHDVLGFSVSLSADGSCVALGAMQNFDFQATPPTMNSTSRPGFAQVHCLQEGDWVQRGRNRLEGSSEVIQGGGQLGSFFGFSVHLSGDGRTLAVGAPVVNGMAGQLSIFRFDEESKLWILRARFEKLGERLFTCGWSLSLSFDGNVAVVGCPLSRVSERIDSGAVRVLREVPCEEEEDKNSPSDPAGEEVSHEDNLTPCLSGGST